MNREAFVTLQNRYIEEFVGLTPDEAAAHAFFRQLAFETFEQVERIEAPKRFISPFKVRPTSGFFGLQQFATAGIELSKDCVDRWRQWERDYPVLTARNPRLELHDIMQDLSEAHEGASWPYMFEWTIERWVANGALPEEPHYRSLNGQSLIEPSVRDRLKELHAKLGGWLYYDFTAEMIVFADTEQFRLVEARRDAERAEALRIAEERRAAVHREMERAIGKENMQRLGQGIFIALRPRPSDSKD
jgi:hypothetical protein